MTSLFVKEATVASLLGRSRDWLKANEAMLEAQYGFPTIDPATGLRHREAIEEWARERNIQRAERTGRLSETNHQENLNAL